MQTHGELCWGSAVQPLLEKRLKPVSLGSQIRGSRIQFAGAQKHKTRNRIVLGIQSLIAGNRAQTGPSFEFGFAASGNDDKRPDRAEYACTC